MGRNCDLQDSHLDDQHSHHVSEYAISCLAFLSVSRVDCVRRALQDMLPGKSRILQSNTVTQQNYYEHGTRMLVNDSIVYAV